MFSVGFLGLGSGRTTQKGWTKIWQNAIWSSGEKLKSTKRFRGQTRVASVENGCSSTSRGLFRTRRVATWLAESRVFPPLEHHFRETVILGKSCATDQAHLRSHAGVGASDVLHGAPTGPEFKVEPNLFRTFVLERLRLPLPVTEAFCECGSPLDVWGRHRAAG